MVVIKFGGAALADSDNIKNSVDYIKKVIDKKPVIVVSAMKGVTDLLVDTIKEALNKNDVKVLQNCESLKDKHKNVVYSLISSAKIKNQILGYLDEKISELMSLFRSVSVLKECTPKSHDYIVSFGEKLSSKLIACVFLNQNIPAEQITGEEIIVTDANFQYAFPDFDLTKKKITERLSKKKEAIPIVTGFIGATQKGETTTLGRGGSDFTASILAYCLDTREVWYMKEIDGIMSADPNIVKNAKTIEKMTYSEVAELSYYGAKILHPIAIHPLKEKKILSYIKNVYKPDFKGTEVSDKIVKNEKTVKAITYIKDVSIITVQGTGMIGIPGFAERVFNAISKGDINVLMISQSSSEQNICFVIDRKDEENALKLLKKEFELEIIKGKIDKVSAENNVSIISVVGEGMKHVPGIAGKLFSALGDHEINIKLIAQGSSELNISFIIGTKDVEKSLNCIHEKFDLGD